MHVPKEQQEAALKAYAKLHDGLSDMIESGRLKESDIPDDYDWLVNSLTRLSIYWHRNSTDKP